MSESNARGLVKSMAIIASAQAVRIAITILRAKVVAVLLGPSGIGLLSVLNNLRDMASTGAGLGLSGSGVRELAAARDDTKTLSRVRRVLMGALLVQGAVAMVLIWLAREPLAVWLLGDARHATEIGLVGVAVLLFLLADSQTTLLQGMRRIADLGRVTVWGTLIGTLAGLAAVVLLGQLGLVWLVLLPPAAGILVALRYTRRLPPLDAVRMTPGDVWRAWLPMVQFGVVLMIGGLAVVGTLLLARARITQEMGLDAAGHFAAAYSIAMIYVSFLLQAIAADYFPRLTEVIGDREAAMRLMNDQLQLVLALGGPILLALIGCAPWVIRLLYSAEFEPAVTILQWQTVGNVFKLATWSLGFAFLAAAQPSINLTTTLVYSGTFLLLIWFGLAPLGFEITGIAFLAAQMLDFIAVALLVHHLHGFRWQRLSMCLFGLHVLLSAGLLALASRFPLAGGLAALALGFATAFAGGHIVLAKVGPHGRLVSRVAWIYERLGWPVRKLY